MQEFIWYLSDRYVCWILYESVVSYADYARLVSVCLEGKASACSCGEDYKLNRRKPQNIRTCMNA